MTIKKNLTELYQESSGKVSLKWELYLKEYDRVLAEYQDRPVNILEIGVQNGGSLEVWSQYFRNAQRIVGVDIDQKCQSLIYSDDRVKVIIGDCCQQDVLEKITGQTATFDFVFDDGSHKSADIIKAFLSYFPKLTIDGVYIIEDLHCSYWANYEGGLFDSYSSIAFIKKLIDIVNHQHWQNGMSINQYMGNFLIQSGLDPLVINVDFLNQIHSIELINSLCIIKKKPVWANIIGKLTIRGSDDSIVLEGEKPVMEQAIKLQNQNENIFSTPAYQNNTDFDIKLAMLRDKLISNKVIIQEKEQDIASLRHENYDLHKKLYEITTQLNQCGEVVQSLNQVIEANKAGIIFRCIRKLQDLTGR
ncbi:class I SAM-dependent methyltransferase [Methylobacter sp. S3L5C]|uniref:class I SAM-dependent methyltransferase n=1 Tax=Methylobacter sp. S3L5C TaxID=2839024 RepID=UPI001FABAA70|nr:class I SAM-dependent methyltransferase [Methylobacter sp. S3L5C]UOA08403.1 class I SAM-dependent methyltransferase [Methylobacter sp. S3L5C]